MAERELGRLLRRVLASQHVDQAVKNARPVVAWIVGLRVEVGVLGSLVLGFKLNALGCFASHFAYWRNECHADNLLPGPAGA